MEMEVTDRVHIAPLGIEYDRVLQPPLEYDADRVVLLDYLPRHVEVRPRTEELRAAFESAGVASVVRECEVTDLFDALAVVGDAVLDHADEEVYVNLATGNKIMAIGGMIACMTTGQARPYYVAAEDHGSHRGPEPRGIRSVDSVPSYPMERPTTEQLRVMRHVRDSDRTDRDGEPYRIKRELIEFGERAELPFVAEYTGETSKGKFRRLDTHILSPLRERGFVEVTEVGTQRRVSLTEDGRNTLRAFAYLVGRDERPE
jgi:hypothetical protein